MNRRRTVLFGMALLWALPTVALELLGPPAAGPGIAAAQQQGTSRTETDAERVLKPLKERGRRLENVQKYVEKVATQGTDTRIPNKDCSSNCIVHDVEDVLFPDGSITKRPRTVNPVEIAVMTGENPTADFLRVLSAGLYQAQDEINDRFGWTRSGGPITPANLLWIGGMMSHIAALEVEKAETSLATGASQAQAELDREIALLEQLERKGPATIEGIPTIQWGLPDGFSQAAEMTGGQRWEFTGGGVWIDPVNQVIVRHRMEGTAYSEGEARPFFIEVIQSDFRNPPGCGEMYEPYRRAMRMGGLLDEAQRAEIEDARRQLADFERQLASMPAGQRRTMERMLGEQLGALRGLAEDGSVQYVQRVEEILCNPDLGKLFGAGGEAGSLPNLVQRIQQLLQQLGYAPGNTEGILDTMTRVAISQFQAEQGLDVTGEPSARLADILASMVEQQQAA